MILRIRLVHAALGSMVILLVGSGCQSPSVPKSGAGLQVAPPPYVDGKGVDEPVHDPAEMCFADTDAYLRIKGLSAHPRTGSDALLDLASELVEELRSDGFSKEVAEAFGDTPAALFHRFFGADVAVVRHGRERNAPVMIISKAAPEDIERLPDALGAMVWSASTTTGGYPTYQFSVGEKEPVEMLLAIGTNWFFLCEKQQVDGLRKMLRAGETARSVLSDHPEYRRFTPEAEAFGFAFVRGIAKDVIGVAAMITEEGYELDLFSEIDLPEDAVLPSPDESSPHPFLVERHTLDFGPIPEHAAAVFALNVLHRKPKDLGVLDIPVIFGSVRSTILPGVEPPLIAALVEVDAPDSKGNETVPAFALCARVDDVSVAKALNDVMGTFHFLATLGALEFKRSIFGISKREYKGSSYTVADFGDGIVARLPESFLLPLVDLPEPSGLHKLSFGRVGDWYVVSSQEACFEACIDAAENPKESWSENPVLNAPELQKLRKNLATFTLEPSRVGTLVEHATARYERAQSDSGNGDEADVATVQPAKTVRPFAALGDVMYGLSDSARDLTEAWRRLHTVAKEEPAPKKKSSLGEKKRTVQSTKPEHIEEGRNALRSLREVSAALERYQTMHFQLWRGSDDHPRATIRMVDH